MVSTDWRIFHFKSSISEILLTKFKYTCNTNNICSENGTEASIDRVVVIVLWGTIFYALIRWFKIMPHIYDIELYFEWPVTCRHGTWCFNKAFNKKLVNKLIFYLRFMQHALTTQNQKKKPIYSNVKLLNKSGIFIVKHNDLVFEEMNQCYL